MRGAKKSLERMRVSWVGAVAAIAIAAPPLVDVSAAQTFRQPGKLPKAIQQPREIEPLRGPGGWLGITLRNLTPAEADQWLLDAGGAVIEGVTQGGPAWRVGLRSGDVVTRFDDHAVATARDLTNLIRDTPPEWTVKASVAREGVSWDIDLTVEVEPGPGAA